MREGVGERQREREREIWEGGREREREREEELTRAAWFGAITASYVVRWSGSDCNCTEGERGR